MVEVMCYMQGMASVQPARPCHLYSTDLKQCVVHQHYTLSKSTTEIAKDLNISLHIVQHILPIYEEIGAVVKDPRLSWPSGRHRLIDPQSVEVSTLGFPGHDILLIKF